MFILFALLSCKKPGVGHYLGWQDEKMHDVGASAAWATLDVKNDGTWTMGECLNCATGEMARQFGGSWSRAGNKLTFQMQIPSEPMKDFLSCDAVDDVKLTCTIEARSFLIFYKE